MFGNDDQNNDQQNVPVNAFGAQPSTGPFGDMNNGQNPPNNSPFGGASSAPPVSSTANSSDAAGSPEDLLGIKQEALQQLSPLVSHLEQSPEEKFRTTMMMIQASDDQSLISSAYEAAKQIPDDKARAQALLDVINEINYFTQQHKS